MSSWWFQWKNIGQIGSFPQVKVKIKHLLKHVKKQTVKEVHTVDGSEIRRSPVEVGSFSHYLQGLGYIPGGCLGFLPSIVVAPNQFRFP